MSAPRRALLAGATGLVGHELLEKLLADPCCAGVTVVGRSALPPRPRLASIVTDLAALDAIAAPAADDAYCALGTTLADAGSQSAFARVDLGFVVAFARFARRASCTRFMLVSALGADPASRVFYSRTKGEAEQAVVALGFQSVHFARPSLLLGPRRTSRPGESVAKHLARAVAPLLRGRLRRYRPVEAATVAAELIAAAQSPATGLVVHHFHEMTAAGAPG